jgi:glycosyltransferase involved in cell wall biosynthesis
MQLPEAAGEVGALYLEQETVDPELLGYETAKYFPVQSPRDLESLLAAGDWEHFYCCLPPLFSAVDFDRYRTRFFCTLHDVRLLEVIEDDYQVYYASALSQYLKIYLKRWFRNAFYRRYQQQLAFLFTLRRAEIVTVSEYSRKAIRCHYPENRAKVHTLYPPPLDYWVQAEQAPALPEGLSPGSYYLLINGDKWLKNNFRALRALDDLYAKGLLARPAVVVGLSARHPFLKRLQKRSRFSVFGYLERNDLENLFANAYGFIYPSLIEGFGYPPLEAMKYGTPVLCAATSSLLEVYQGSALFFNPYSLSEISNAVLRLEEADQAAYAALRRTSREAFDRIQQRQSRDADRLIRLLLSGEES